VCIAGRASVGKVIQRMAAPIAQGQDVFYGKWSGGKLFLIFAIFTLPTCPHHNLPAKR
jgi:hypothetical protein